MDCAPDIATTLSAWLRHFDGLPSVQCSAVAPAPNLLTPRKPACPGTFSSTGSQSTGSGAARFGVAAPTSDPALAAGALASLAAEALARGDVLGVAAGSLRAREAAGTGAGIATQMHGAIGFTREHALHLYTTSLWTWRDEFGGQVYWGKLLGQAALAAGGDGYWPMVTDL